MTMASRLVMQAYGASSRRSGSNPPSRRWPRSWARSAASAREQCLQRVPFRRVDRQPVCELGRGCRSRRASWSSARQLVDGPPALQSLSMADGASETAWIGRGRAGLLRRSRGGRRVCPAWRTTVNDGVGMVGRDAGVEPGVEPGISLEVRVSEADDTPPGVLRGAPPPRRVARRPAAREDATLGAYLAELHDQGRAPASHVDGGGAGVLPGLPRRRARRRGPRHDVRWRRLGSLGRNGRARGRPGGLEPYPLPAPAWRPARRW